MNNCLFCRIIAKEFPAKFEYEDNSLVAIQDINPQAPTHFLIIPKRHISKMDEVQKSDCALLGDMMLKAKDLASKNKLDEGFRLVLNNGSKAGQSVFHIHLHLIGGRTMHWPPG